MNVKQLIKLLKEVDQDLPVVSEGCDCEGDAVGISRVDDRLVIRREDGPFRLDKLEIVRPK